jgi:sarcosine oxidase subunit alpha
LRWRQLFQLNVQISNLTGQLAAINLAGPESRNVLKDLTSIDVAGDAFPYLGVRRGTVAGVAATLMRVGFVGELGYEIHLPASSALYVWEKLAETGRPFGLKPFGVEAQRLLRLEKGHLIVGHDTDALTYPAEADLNWAIAKNKPFFVGSRSLEILQQRPLTRQLVGFRLADIDVTPFPEECHLIFDDDTIVGRVTSITRYSTLKHPLGMAFVHPRLAAPGSQLHIRTAPGNTVTGEVCSLPFYDPENLRQQ